MKIEMEIWINANLMYRKSQNIVWIVDIDVELTQSDRDQRSPSRRRARARARPPPAARRRASRPAGCRRSLHTH